MSDIWVEKVHETYEETRKRNQYIEDHYTGAVKKKAIARAKKLSKNSGNNSKGELYLFRRAQGETYDAYLERVQLSKYPRHDAAVVDSFSGSIFSVEPKADRTLEAFGELDDESSFAYKFWRNADGQGTNYPTMFKKAAGMFTNYKRVWFLVEEDSFTWIKSAKVKNWFYTDGVLSDVLVEEVVDDRADIKSDYGKSEDRVRWVHYHREGFDRYRIAKDDKGDRRLVQIEDESGSWEYYHYNDIGQEHITVPIGFIDLPIEDDAHPGESMAEDANYLYNLLSDVRNLLRIANHPKLAGDVTDEQFEFTEQALQKGSNMLQGPWGYISPSPENAAAGHEIYKQEVRDFYLTSHQRYNDAAKEVTATEARQDDQSGRQAYLVLLSGTLDELENRVNFFLAQKQFPTDTSKWLVNSVERSIDFKAENSNEFADRLAKRYFSGPVPVGATGQSNAAKKIASLDGVEIEEDELEANIEEANIEREQQQAIDDELNSILSV